jgi:toxin ParE1/3/4
LAHKIAFSPEAESQLVALRRYIADEAGLAVARTFTDGIVQQCLNLDMFPNRGVPRDDLRPGLRTISFRGRVTIAYAVEQEGLTVLAILYAGQDIDAFLREP